MISEFLLVMCIISSFLSGCIVGANYVKYKVEKELDQCYQNEALLNAIIKHIDLELEKHESN